MATYDLAYPGAAIDAILNTAYFLQEAGYIFQGSASEYSGTPSKRVWVIAPAGFTGLGLSSAVPQGSIGICLYNGTSWVGKIINVATIDSTPTQNSGNAVSSGGAYAAINQLSASVTEALENLTFTDTTPSAFQDEYINMKVSTTEGGVERILTYLTILAATTSKAGLMSAEDKAKVDSFLTNLRSLTFTDTTASADQGTKITETLKATIGGVQEVIDSITILAATSSKAGLLSASDKAYIDALPSALTNLSNSISAALALMESLVGYYTCDTAAATAAKTVTATGYSLTNGGCIRIKMTNANTAANVTLNINSTGAKALYYDGAQASSSNTWEAGEVLEVYYDGTQYQCVSSGGGHADRVKYDNTESGLQATNVQGAVDELSSELDEMATIVVANVLTDVGKTLSNGTIYNTTGKWSVNADYYGYWFSIAAYRSYKLRIRANANGNEALAFTTAIQTTNNANVSYATGWSNSVTIEAGTIQEFTIPEDANYVFILTYGNGDRSPQEVSIISPTKDMVLHHELEIDSLNERVGDIEDELNYEEVTQQSNFSSDVKKQGQTRTHISPELIVGNTYRFHVVLSSSATGDITPLLYINSNTSDNTYIGLNVKITNGKTEITFDYTPAAATNYQYLGWWSVNDVRTANVTISLVETTTLKEHVKSIDNEIEDLAHQVQEYTEMGEDIFDISKQNTAQTTAENLSCTKTETGYSFVCTTATSNKYAYGTVGSLVVGEKYRLEFDYTHDLKVTGTYAGMLRMMFSDPLSSSNFQDIIHWILKDYPASGHLSFTFTAEYNTYYLRMAASDIGTGGSVILSNIQVINLAKSDYIESIVESVVELPDTGVDTASVRGYYDGNKIPSIEAGSYKIGYTKVCNSHGAIESSVSVQACAAYNGYLFEFMNDNVGVNIYNLAASTPAFHSTVIPTNISTGHCNSACFGTMKYDNADTFPLLYTSGGQSADYNKVQVYRVTLDNDVFTITQVQDITMPVATEANRLYWAQIYIDDILGDMWYVGNHKGARWVRFKIPQIKDGDTVISSVVLTDSDVIDEFSTLGFVHQHGGIIVNGYCYIMDGVPIWGDTVYMRVFDVWGRKMINNAVNITRLAWTYEPEGIGLYDNHLYVNTQGNGIFKFFF